jgi:tryptophanase
MTVVGDTVAAAWGRRDAITGLRMTYEAPVLRHFTARFEPLIPVRRSTS